MFWNGFTKNREKIERQYAQTDWNESSGLPPEELDALADACVKKWTDEGMDRPTLKAKLFALVLDYAQLSVVPEELFQDHIRHAFIVQHLRQRWIDTLKAGELAQETAENQRAYELGLGTGECDFGHTVPDWYDILQLGIPGLLERIRNARDEHVRQGTLTQAREGFYRAGEIVYEAAVRYARRLGALCRKTANEGQAEQAEVERLLYCAQDLEAIASGAPRTLHQALQLAYLFHILQEEVEGERLRSLGGLDRLYSRFMEADLANGTLTRENIRELWSNLFQKFHALTGDTLYGEPMYLGGTLPDGSCAVNEFSYLILEAYDELNVANPKFHIRVSAQTPPEWIKAVLGCVRRGNSSFVFVSDDCAIPMMMDQVGATLEEAREYVPIGCYEPGILGREVACTGNGGISLPKAVELALNGGVDPLSGEALGTNTGDIEGFQRFEHLMEAVKTQVRNMARGRMEIIRRYEARYMQMNPSPLFSGTLRECVACGMDAYAGGAKYNNSSLYGYGIATAADSLAMIQKWVYERRVLTLRELNGALLANWKGRETLQMRVRNDPDKFGNNRELPDRLACELSECFAEAVNATANGRGGHFKAALFSIDANYYYGKRLGASADGRMAGDIISRNTGAASTRDRSGVTAHIKSVTRLNIQHFPTGSVLDILLHPSAVSGEDGLDAFYQLLKTYFRLGGFAIHGNVMDAAVLRRAQAHPEAYANLQVRVCGWNVYFVNLSREEQDEFIARAEAC